MAASGHLYKKLPYDPVKSFAPIVLAATQWRANEIRAREAKLLQLIGRIWRIDLTGSGAAVSPQDPEKGARRRRRG